MEPEKKKRGGQIGNNGGRPRKFRRGTVMQTISVPADDAELLKLISIAVHNSPEARAIVATLAKRHSVLSFDLRLVQEEVDRAVADFNESGRKAAIEISKILENLV